MASEKSEVAVSACPCGSGDEYVRCCDRFLSAGEVSQTAEQLMRSRYCGFTLRHEAHLKATWHPKTLPNRVRLNDRQRWLGLKSSENFINLNSYRWKKHCRGLLELPLSA